MKPGQRKCSSRAIFLAIHSLETCGAWVLYPIADIRYKYPIQWRKRPQHCGSVRGGTGGEENSRRDVRGEQQQQHGARVLQPVPSIRLPVPELALFRRREDRAHSLSREVGRAVAT